MLLVRLDQAGSRRAAVSAGVDNTRARRYVEAAQAAGLSRHAVLATVRDRAISIINENAQSTRSPARTYRPQRPRTARLLHGLKRKRQEFEGRQRKLQSTVPADHNA